MRRPIAALLAVILLTGPAAAQVHNKTPVVGVFWPGAANDSSNAGIAMFFSAMRELGYIEGRNVVFERRFYGFDANLGRGFAEDLLRLKVDVIFSPSTLSTRILKPMTRDIPIVIAAAADPIGDGFVASLAHPGGNITGLTQSYPDYATKAVQHLKEVIPNSVRVAVLRNPDKNADDSPTQVALESALRAVGVAFRVYDTRLPADFAPTMEAIARDAADAVLMLDDTLFAVNSHAVVAEAMKRRLPMFCSPQTFRDTDCIVTYAPDLNDNFKRAAVYVDRILKGAKPADLPVEQPTKFEMVVNLKTARALGLTVPQSILLRADEVIE